MRAQCFAKKGAAVPSRVDRPIHLVDESIASAHVTNPPLPLQSRSHSPSRRRRTDGKKISGLRIELSLKCCLQRHHSKTIRQNVTDLYKKIVSELLLIVSCLVPRRHTRSAYPGRGATSRGPRRAVLLCSRKILPVLIATAAV